MNYSSQIDYSDKYYDETYEYRWRRRKGVRHRHVTLPKELSKQITPGKLLSEKQVHFKDLVSEKTKRKYEATIKMEVQKPEIQSFN